MTSISLIQPDWPAPANVKTLITTRQGGSSQSPFSSLNLALHVEDDPGAVTANRAALAACAPKVEAWQWLDQVHGCDVHKVESAGGELSGDALVTASSNLGCCVLTADCLPVLICNLAGNEVAVTHGGWRSLAGGILANTLTAMQSSADSLLVWLGPAIGPCHFEVGYEVRELFLAYDSSTAMELQFVAQDNGKYLADLYGIARTQLTALGVERVFGGDFCTFCDQERFFSYRRDGRCGRQLSAIYLEG